MSGGLVGPPRTTACRTSVLLQFLGVLTSLRAPVLDSAASFGLKSSVIRVWPLATWYL